MDTEWASYDRWGTVLHQLVYGGGSANQPVYLNVENELLLQSATLLGLPSDVETIEKDLVTSVTRVLDLHGRTADPPCVTRNEPSIQALGLDSSHACKRNFTAHRSGNEGTR